MVKKTEDNDISVWVVSMFSGVLEEPHRNRTTNYFKIILSTSKPSPNWQMMLLFPSKLSTEDLLQFSGKRSNSLSYKIISVSIQTSPNTLPLFSFLMPHSSGRNEVRVSGDFLLLWMG